MKTRTPTIGSRTPWGPAEIIEERNGFLFIHTAGHGGFWLNPDQMRDFRALFPDAKLYAGAPWFEEDCDWALVPLTFPDAFDRETVSQAVESANAWLTGVPEFYWTTPQGRLALACHADHSVFQNQLTTQH